MFIPGITSTEGGKQGLAELQETKIFTWELSVSLDYIPTTMHAVQAFDKNSSTGLQ